jgi:hypothetical protein
MLKLNTAPYFDDFEVKKGFYKIPAVPGRALQVRDFTQIQTIAQSQIQKGFDGIYKNGTVVNPGHITYDLKFTYIQLINTTQTSLNLLDPLSTVNNGSPVFIYGSSGIKAQVILLVRAVNSDPDTLYIKYVNSGVLGPVFSISESILLDPQGSVVTTVGSSVTSVGIGSAASISDGVYYVNSYFVNVFSQTIILDKYTNIPSYRVGLAINDSFITSDMDQSLFDNAQGSPNFSAPGFDRYKIELILTKITLDAVSGDESFIELLRLNTGQLQSLVNKTNYSILDDALARRTFAQSGNFIIRPFQLDVKEHLDNGTNRGVYTTVNGGDPTKLVLGLSPGYGFVNGYEVETVGTTNINVPKARTTNTVIATRTRAYIGTYILTANLFGFPSHDSYPTLALMNAKVTSGGSSSNGTQIGTAQIRSIQYDQPGLYRLYLFNIKLNSGYSLDNALSFYCANGGSLPGSTGDLCSVIKVVNYGNQNFAIGDTIDSITSGTAQSETVVTWDNVNGIIITKPLTATIIPAGDSIRSHGNTNVTSATVVFRNKINDPVDNILVYKLPNNIIQSVRTAAGTVNAAYTIKKTYIATAPAAAGSFTVTFTANSTETFVPFTLNDYLLTNQDTGEIITLSSSNVTVSPTTCQITLVVGEAGHNLKLSATLVETGIQEKTKTLNGNTAAPLIITAPVSNTILLGKADIYKIVSITEITTGSVTIDITSRYTLDNGQRDNFYDLGSISLNLGQTPPSSTSTVSVIFQYFTHSSNGDYFTINSYTNFDSTTDWYANVPSYKSKTIGTGFNLRDCLDIRPRVDDNGTTFTTSGKLLAPNSDFVADFSYYVSRVDLVYIDYKANFNVVSGIPSLHPVTPAEPKDGATLYIIKYNPYTFNTKDIQIQAIPNKGFKNKDIGNIETRVNILEQYASLNLLESSTNNLKIIDATTGLDRFKNGFIVDGFVNQGVSDTANPDFKCSMDYKNGILRPSTTVNNFKLILDQINSKNYEYQGIKSLNDLITLPYAEVSFVNQPYATGITNINPYAVYNWNGSISLTPASDDWMDTKTIPDIVINDSSSYDAALANNGIPVLGTIWNSWQTDWTGATYVQSFDTTPGAPPYGTFIPTLNGQSQTRTGTTNVIVSSIINTIVDNKILNIAMVPYIRSRYVKFQAKRLKPNTKFYPYFDNTNISAYCKPFGSDPSTPNDSVNFGTTLLSDAFGNVNGWFLIPSADVLKFKTGSRIFRLTDDSNNSLAADSFADTVYAATGTIETVQRTVVSSRVASIETQSVTENRIISSTSASGVNTTPAVNSVSNLTPAQFLGALIGLPQYKYVDPLSQSFLVTNLPGGATFTSISLFFGSKDASLPVTIQLREMQNGTPTQKIIPLSEVVLLPSQINISNDASVSTDIKFISPVYLQNDTEYCVTILANSNLYTIFTAKLGETMINSDRIVSQPPYAGSLFKSQNGSTWIPAAGETLKFVLYRAKYSTSVTASINLTNEALTADTLKVLPFITSNGSNKIRVIHANHGLTNGSKTTVVLPTFELVGPSSYNGILATAINNIQFTVSNVENNSYIITTATNATQSGRVGPIGVLVTKNIGYNACLVNLQKLSFAGTHLNFGIKTTSSTSIDGTETAYLKDLVFTPVSVNNNLYFNTPRLIGSVENEPTITPSGNTPSDFKSFIINVSMSTDLDNVSPIIDLQRFSVITIQNIISNSTPANRNVIGFDDTAEKKLTAADFQYMAADNSINSASLNFINTQYAANSFVSIPSILSYARIISVTAHKIVVAPDINGTLLSNASGQTITLSYFDHFIANLASVGTSNHANYPTKTVTLNDHANAIHVYMDVLRPNEASFRLYAKTVDASTNVVISDYVLLTPNASTDTSASTDGLTFKNYVFELENIPSFISVVFKIEMKSVNSSLVPQFQNFRAICLGT